MTVYRVPPVDETQKTSSAIADLVAKREQARGMREHRRRMREASEHAAAIAKHAQRPMRVSVEPRRLKIARQSVVDGLRDQAEWGIVFGGFMIGMAGFPVLAVTFIFVAGMPMLLGMLLAAIGWAGVVVGANALYVRWTNPPWILDVTADGCFALHSGDAAKPKLVGRTHELKVSVPEPDPARLHCVGFEHATGSVVVRHLTDRDVRSIRQFRDAISAGR